MNRRGYFPARRSKWLGAVIALPLLAALALSACSSSGSSGASNGTGASTGTGAASAAASGATGSTYVIGSIGTYTGPLVGDTTVTEQIFQIWADYTNASGGINGHPVKVISMDDGGNPATGITEANKLVADHVLAIVGMESQVYAAWAPVFDKAGIPVIGGQSFASNFSTDPLWFPAGAAGTGTAYSDLAIAVKQGKKHLAVFYCSESADCARSSTLLKDTVQHYASSLDGMTFAYSAGVSASAPSYSSECLAAKQAGVDTAFFALAGPTAVRVTQDCASQGLKLLPLVSSQTAEPSWATANSPMEGVVSSNGTFPWTADDTAAAKAFQNAIAKYDPSFMTSVGYSDAASEIWTSLELFKGAAVSGDLGSSPTPTDVVNSFYTLPKNYTVNGLASTLNFIKGKPAPAVPCGFVTELRNGKFVAPEGSTLLCSPGGTRS